LFIRKKKYCSCAQGWAHNSPSKRN
jgi:hypothetical protein